MIRRFFRHLGESIKNLKRNLLSTLTAVFSVMIVLSLLGVFGSVILNTQKLASDIEKNIRCKKSCKNQANKSRKRNRQTVEFYFFIDWRKNERIKNFQ